MSSPRLRASLALALVLTLTGLVAGETASLALSTDSASRLRLATALGVDSSAAIGEEHPAAPASRQSVTSGTRSRVASDGTDYLVLWHQDPRGLNASRVDRSGNVVGEPILISQAGLNNDASVSFGGGNYLVVWVTDGSEIRGTRITPDGQVLDPGGFVIAAGTPDAPDLAFDGTNFMAVWQTGSNVVAARIGPSGTVLDPTPRVLSEPGQEVGRPRIAFSGTDHLVTWGVTSGPIGSSYAVQIKPSGDVVAPGVQEIPGAFRAGSPGAVFDGTNWLIGYGASQGGGDLLARRLSPAGAWVGGVITITAAPESQSALQLVRSGTGVYAVWADYRRTDVEPGDLYGTLIDGSGTVINPGGVPLLASDDSEELPAIAAGGGQLLLSFDLGRGVDEPLSAARLSPTGAVLDPSPFPVSFVTSSQEAPKVAYDGTNHLVVWNDDRRLSGRPEVFAARVSPSGESLDPDGFEISFGHENTHVTDVVFDGTNYLVAWSNYFDVYVTVVGTDGSLRSPQPIPVAVDPDLSDTGARLSVDGQNTLVVWGRYDPDSESDQIVAARISRSGTVLDPEPLAIATGAEDEQQATVAFDGTNHLVVYVGRNGGGDDGDVFARRVSPAGAVLDASPLPVATTADEESSPDLAWSGNTYLAVWERIPHGAGSGRRVMGARIDRLGQLVEPGAVRLSEAEDEQDDPSVASRNGWFLVAWTRRRDSDSDVLAVRFRENGEKVDRSGFIVSESADTPDVATGGDSWTTAYSHGDPTFLNSGRVFSRTVTPK